MKRQIFPIICYTAVLFNITCGIAPTVSADPYPNNTTGGNESTKYCVFNRTVEKVERALMIGFTTLSIFACVTAFVIYFLVRNIPELMVESKRHWIHWNFMASFIIRDVVVLTTYSLCDTISLLEQPIRTISLILGAAVIVPNFFWMFVEGFYLFLGLLLHLRLRQLKWMKLKLSIIGWGVPCLLVAIWTTVELLTDGDFNYVSPKGLIVLLPMYLVLLANLLMMLRVLYTLGHLLRIDRRRGETTRKIAKRTIFLSIVLGVYIIIPVIISKSTENKLVLYVTHFIFSVLSTIQGLLVAVLYVLLNDEVMQYAIRHLPKPLRKPIQHLYQAIRRLSTTSSASSSARGSRTRFSAISTVNGGGHGNNNRYRNSDYKTSITNSYNIMISSNSPSISSNPSPTGTPGITPNSSPRSSRASSIGRSPRTSPRPSADDRYLTPGTVLHIPHTPRRYSPRSSRASSSFGPSPQSSPRPSGDGEYLTPGTTLQIPIQQETDSQTNDAPYIETTFVFNSTEMKASTSRISDV